jgi:hypothetical protein
MKILKPKGNYWSWHWRLKISRLVSSLRDTTQNTKDFRVQYESDDKSDNAAGDCFILFME